MKIIVLTGGTLGGKTTIIKKLKLKYKNKIVIVPEVATILFRRKFKRPEKWTLEWHYSLQKAILEKQLELEKKALLKAENIGASVIICDRAMLDQAAYLDNGLSELIEQFGVDEDSVLLRYFLVIHLVSLSIISPKLYNIYVKSNPFRIESLKDARRQEIGTLKAWSNHTNRVILKDTLDKNFEKISSIIDNIKI